MSEKNKPETRTGNSNGTAMDQLLANPPRVVNIGVPGFAEELSQQGVEVVHVDWRPPAGGDPEMARILSLVGT